MQNDVRELSDNELRRLVVLYAREVKNWPEAEEAAFAVFERLSALCAEVEHLKADKEHLIGFADNFAGQVERLKAELSKRPTEAEAVVMRELCEAVDKHAKQCLRGRTEEQDRLWARIDAYRAMKGEK